MDKQKQIEEMAKDYYGYSIDLEDDCKFVAEEMYDKGHRKIPEGVVVLTEEQMDMLVSRPYYEDQVRKTRKETAEKFERLANERIAKEQGERDGYDAYRIDDKAKYDGDIVSFVLFEICKEIIGG